VIKYVEYIMITLRVLVGVLFTLIAVTGLMENWKARVRVSQQIPNQPSDTSG
jgi:hypothetical protein